MPMILPLFGNLSSASYNTCCDQFVFRILGI